MLIAQFYIALYPVGDPSGYLDAENFFQQYLAGPFLIALYLIWKTYSWFKVPEHRRMYIPIKDIDVYSGMRQGQVDMISGAGVTEDARRESIAAIKEENKKHGAKDYFTSIVRSVF